MASLFPIGGCLNSLTPQQQQTLALEVQVAQADSGWRYEASTARAANQTPYTAGDVVTTGFTFLGDPNRVGQSARLSSVYVLYPETSVPVGMTTFTLHFFTALPTFADNDAFNLGSVTTTVLSTYLGNITTTAAVDDGSIVLATANGSSQVLTPAASSSTIYGILVTNGGFTPTADSEIVGISIEAVYV